MGKQMFRGGFAVSRRLLPAETSSFAGLLDVTLLAGHPWGYFHVKYSCAFIAA